MVCLMFRGYRAVSLPRETDDNIFLSLIDPIAQLVDFIESRFEFRLIEKLLELIEDKTEQLIFCSELLQDRLHCIC
jgi:hypothetical protein